MFRLEVTNYYMNARAKRKEDESRWPIGLALNELIYGYLSDELEVLLVKKLQSDGRVGLISPFAIVSKNKVLFSRFSSPY
ncbi:uncharacterized protein LOC132307437 isoform X2 [Cornus florida]|uniref:uncharacterized protein LOC132307437 isoform X2 n=1 Tax=Cornus florida TaxID=4283 RepID=UPI00289AB1A5|nr:uncharacterized protein LOC132307437 isoform X2 [Cornus florida]